MDFLKEYQQKLLTPEAAANLVQDGDCVDFGQGCAFPRTFERALGNRVGEVKDVQLRSAISVAPLMTVENDPEGKSFTFNLWHCSGLDRKYVDKGRAFFEPMLFRHCGPYYTKEYVNVDVAVITVAPMDRFGNFSFGLNNCTTQDILDKAKTIIVEVNETMPVVFGLTADRIHISQVDYIVESTDPVAALPPSAPATPDDIAIANFIFPHLEDEITLQLGIGGMPDTLGTLIADSDLKDLGMHTELMASAYLKLYEAGKITDRKKTIDRGKGIFGTCMGTRELYDFLHMNSQILSAPMTYTNDPAVIKQHEKFVSINSCISMDLYGQVCSESVGTRHISGTGGQLDFVTGAFESPGGKAFLTMKSVNKDKNGNLRSNILPKFTGGDIITTPRTQAPFMVTEQGIANLTGKSSWERAEAIIGIAHPDFREDLIKAAEEQKIWRKSNKR